MCHGTINVTINGLIVKLIQEQSFTLKRLIHYTKMGCNRSKQYVAKETFHPFDNEWEGFTTKSFNEADSKVVS